MAPVPRARLCHDESPGGPGLRSAWVRSSHRARCKLHVANELDAPAVSTAMPSRRATRPISLTRASLPHSASTALPRFKMSLAYFHRMMSSTAVELNPAWARHDATATARLPPPPPRRGQRPDVEDAGRRNRRGLHHARCQVRRRHHDAHSVDLGNQHSATRSFSTPFWAHTTATSDRAAARDASSAARRCPETSWRR